MNFFEDELELHLSTADNKLSFNTVSKLFRFAKSDYVKIDILSFFERELKVEEDIYSKYAASLSEEDLEALEERVALLEEYIDFVLKDGKIENAVRSYKINLLRLWKQQ